MTPARFRWGLILVQIGLLMLLRNFNILSDNFWFDLLLFFPLVLILVGIEKIFTKSKLQFISYGTSVLLFAAGFLIAFTGSGDGFEGSFFSETTLTEKYEPGVEQLHAIIKVDETDVTIRDSGDDLLKGEFGQFTRKPNIMTEYSGNKATITLTRRDNSWFGGAVKIDTDEPQDWKLQFNRDIPLNLECYGNSSLLHLNFATTPLERLVLDADESDVYLKIGDMTPDVNIEIKGDRSRLKLRVPADIKLKIFGEDFRSYLYAVGLIEDTDGSFTNDTLSNGKNSININLDDRLESFSLDYF